MPSYQLNLYLIPHWHSKCLNSVVSVVVRVLGKTVVFKPRRPRATNGNRKLTVPLVGLFLLLVLDWKTLVLISGDFPLQLPLRLPFAAHGRLCLSSLMIKRHRYLEVKVWSGNFGTTWKPALVACVIRCKINFYLFVYVCYVWILSVHLQSRDYMRRRIRKADQSLSSRVHVGVECRQRDWYTCWEGTQSLLCR